jgi:hypothetical protein
MIAVRTRLLPALAFSLALHASLLPWMTGRPPTPLLAPPPLRVSLAPVPAAAANPRPVVRPVHAASKAPIRTPDAPTPPAPQRAPDTLAAPPAPTAEDWQLASTYVLRNSKRYRHTWGQQVRSMMGTAVEGPEQGMVRFRIEIAPDGTLAKAEERWSTSALASKLAWQAIRKLPPLPPTPTGEPLVFEQTISFLPYETGWPPSYRLDCLPQPEAYKNPYAWNGAAPAEVAARAHRPPPPEGCPPDSTAETIEEEEQDFKRQMEQWRWGR